MWNTTTTGVNTNHALAQDDFYLITPIDEQSLWKYIVSVAIPFNGIAWLFIFGLIFFLGFALHFMKADSYSQKYRIKGPCSFCHRITHMIYVSFTSFTAMDVSLSSESTGLPEKIISVGFVVFALLIITSYTASVASALVRSDVILRYSSLEDVARDPLSVVCLYSESVDQMQTVSSGIDVLGINGTVFDILDEISDSKRKCSAAVLPIIHYERAVAMEPDYCDKSRILLDEFMFSFNVVIYFSRDLGQIGIDLLDAVNSFIDTGEYSLLDTKYLNHFRSVDFDLNGFLEDIILCLIAFSTSICKVNGAML